MADSIRTICWPAGRAGKRDIRIRGSRTEGISAPGGDVSECYNFDRFVRGRRTYRPIIV